MLRQAAPDTDVVATQDLSLTETQRAHVDVSRTFLASRIGTSLDSEEVAKILGSLGFDLRSDSEMLHLVAPTWRSTGDISLPQDIVEEVARIYVLDSLRVSHLPIVLRPARSLRARPIDRVARETLAIRAGLREVVTYPWVSDALLTAALPAHGTIRTP